MELSELIKKLNEKLQLQYWYFTDPIYSRDIHGELIFLGRANSIYNDFRIYPFTNHTHKTFAKYWEAKSTINWINNKLFTSELNQLLQNRLPLRTTSEVRLRIATNMIYTHKNQYITPEEREEWAQWLHEIYWQRRKRIADYYFIEILQLPF